MKKPKTKEEVIEILLKELSEKDKSTLAQVPKDKLIMFHFDLGMYIRNKFLYPNKKLVSSCLPPDPDSISMEIIEGLWRRLRAGQKGGKKV